MPDETRRLLERTADLGGAGYRIFDVTLRTNPRWINTDGFDIHATDVHIRGADVTNGDDSICAPPLLRVLSAMKAFPSSHQPGQDILFVAG